MQKAKNARGFALVEILLVVAVVTIVGVAGFIVYNQHHNKPRSDATTGSSLTSSKDKTGTATSNPIYKSTPYGYTFSYPATWETATTITDLGNSSRSSLILKTKDLTVSSEG